MGGGTAFLFDLDGTLVDSVYQHVLAWREALEQVGVEEEGQGREVTAPEGGDMSPRDDLGPGRPKRAGPAGDRPKPPVVGVEKVTCACGHEADLPLYPDRQDKFRAARRQDLINRPCPACRQKAHAELTAREQAAAAERRKSRGGPPPRKEKAARPPAERLPHGSAFAVSYDAGAKKWGGTLTVPTAEGNKAFRGEAGAVFKLLEQLDGQYREWLSRQPAGPAPAPGGGEAAAGPA